MAAVIAGPHRRALMPIEENERSRRLRERRPDRRVPDQRRDRQIEGAHRDQHDRRQTDPDRLRPLPDRDQQERVDRRLQRRLTDAAGMRQVLEPGTEHDADRPQDPIKRRTDRVSVHVSGRPDERQLREGSERDFPIPNLVARAPRSAG